jgi:hypothetical protein
MIAASPKDFMTSNCYGGKLSAGSGEGSGLQARVVRRDALSRIQSWLFVIMNFDRGFLAFTGAVKHPHLSPCCERRRRIRLLGWIGCAMRWHHQIPAHQRERGCVSESHSLLFFEVRTSEKMHLATVSALMGIPMFLNFWRPSASGSSFISWR